MSIVWEYGEGSKTIPRAVHLALARQATERFPDSAPAWYALAENLAYGEDFADVAAASERAARLAPPTPAQLALYANALITLGRAAEAVDVLERHALQPDARLRALRGEALRQAGRLADARIDLEAALAADPQDAVAGGSLSRLLTDQGAWQDLLDAIARIEARGRLSMALEVARTRALAWLGRHEQVQALMSFADVGRMRTLEAPADFGGLAHFNGALVAELDSPLHSRLADKPRLRLAGGVQIEDLTASGGPALQALFAAIRAEVEAYFEGSPHPAPARAELVPWALVLGPEDYQARHYHVEAALAGVYYVAAPHEALDEESEDGALVIPDLSPDLGGDAALARRIKPRPGRLVLFPGYLPHSTRPTHGAGRRISIAFNVLSRDQPA